MADRPTGSTRAPFTIVVGSVALALALPAPVAAQTAPEITMRLYDGSGLSERMTSDLRAVTESVLAPAGIAVRWRLCARTAPSRHHECDQPPGRFVVVVRVAETHEDGVQRHCGFALPMATGQGFISLARACATRTATALQRAWHGRDAVTEAQILGYALAHELAHVLLPGVAHSTDGVFRARLGRRHWRMLRAGRLWFSARDAARLRAAAAGRPTPVVAAGGSVAVMDGGGPRAFSIPE